MTDTQPTGYGKVGASIVAAWVASYIMTQASLHGVDFSLLGVSSEIVKSTIIGVLSGFFTWLTPKAFVQSVTNAIVFGRQTIKQWHQALTSNNGDTP